MNRRYTLPLLAVLAALLAAPLASAKPPESFQIQTHIGNRIWEQTAWIPAAVDTKPGKIQRLRLGGQSWRGIWLPVAIGGPSAAFAFEQAWRGRRYSTTAVIADARLTARQRRRYAVVAELYRDADVLVVAAGHPACAGITRAQARAIVRGGITRWSEVTAEDAGAIQVRYPSAGGAEHAESHFGVIRPMRRFARMPYARGARPAPDGGVGAAAAGDRSIAAISTWSRVRSYGTAVCAVPLDGVAPSDATVLDLSYPEAFPVTDLRPRQGATALKRAQWAAMQRLFATEEFKTQLRGRGLLLPGG